MSPPFQLRSPLYGAAVRLRRILVRRPWIHWAVVGIAAAGAAASALDRSDRVDAAREAWGETSTVHVASRPLEPGDEVRATTVEIPTALLGDHAAPADVLDGAVARQRIAEGEVIATVDVVSQPGPTAMIPAGWLGVPVVESPASGAGLGERVLIASDGLVIGEEALVIGRVDGVTLVAVPAEIAPVLPAAAEGGSLT
ncbi:MAG: hypothetical protein HKN41_12285, partial [Ilumatobacter sp.]|nr:hypothetical protein [Ilumatobacter sp.]